MGHDVGLIDDEEFIVLRDLYSSGEPDFPYNVYAPFDLDELDESESVAEFCFRKTLSVERTSIGRGSTDSRYHNL